MAKTQPVIPAKAGIQFLQSLLDPGLRRGDGPITCSVRHHLLESAWYKALSKVSAATTLASIPSRDRLLGLHEVSCLTAPEEDETRPILVSSSLKCFKILLDTNA